MEFQIQQDDLKGFSSSSSSIIRQLIDLLPLLMELSLGDYLRDGINIDRLSFAIETCDLKAGNKQIQQLNREIGDFVDKKKKKKLRSYQPDANFNLEKNKWDSSFYSEDYAKPQTGNFYQQIKNVIHKHEDFIENIITFSVEGIKREDINNLLDNLSYQNQNKKQQFIRYILNGNESISKEVFFHKIQIDPNIKRSPIMPLQPQYISVAQPYLLSKLSKQEKQNPKIQQIENCLESKQVFKDANTPKCRHTPYSVHLAEQNNQYYLFSKVQQQLKENQRRYLINLLQPQDVAQGKVESCYFLAAIVSLTAQYPQLIYNLFVVSKNPSHIYGVRLFIDGKWQIILLDTRFPINKERIICCAQWKDKNIWPLLLQKAFAKISGSYDIIEIGKDQQGIRILTGAPSIYFDMRNKERDFIKIFKEAIREKSILACYSILDKKVLQQVGLVDNHSYSIIHIYPRTIDNKQTNMIKLRTPWEKGGWIQKNGQRSIVWTKQRLKLKNNIDFDEKNGTFSMSEQKFMAFFTCVNVCRIEVKNVNSFYDLDLRNGQFTSIDITINTKGKYSFTIYLKDERKIRSYNQSRKRLQWMFLFKKQGEKLKGISSSASQNDNNTLQIQGKLNKGEYMLSLCVFWSHQNQQYRLASYGPNPVHMDLNKAQFNQQCLSDYMDRYIELFLNPKYKQKQVAIVKDKHVYKSVIYSHLFGYLVMQISNRQKYNQRVTIEIQENVKILPPNKSQIIELKSEQKIIIKFLVPYNFKLQFINLQIEQI